MSSVKRKNPEALFDPPKIQKQGTAQVSCFLFFPQALPIDIFLRYCDEKVLHIAYKITKKSTFVRP